LRNILNQNTIDPIECQERGEFWAVVRYKRKTRRKGKKRKENGKFPGAREMRTKKIPSKRE